MAVGTLDEALRNLVDGVTGKGAKYDKKQPTMVSHFNTGFDKFGITVGAVTRGKYDKGTKDKGKKLEDNAIVGARAKWIDNYKLGLSV